MFQESVLSTCDKIQITSTEISLILCCELVLNCSSWSAFKSSWCFWFSLFSMLCSTAVCLSTFWHDSSVWYASLNSVSHQSSLTHYHQQISESVSHIINKKNSSSLLHAVTHEQQKESVKDTHFTTALIYSLNTLWAFDLMFCWDFSSSHLFLNDKMLLYDVMCSTD